MKAFPKYESAADPQLVELSLRGDRDAFAHPATSRWPARSPKQRHKIEKIAQHDACPGVCKCVQPGSLMDVKKLAAGNFPQRVEFIGIRCVHCYNRSVSTKKFPQKS